MLHECVNHYNIEVNFFCRFLDPYMKYGCGLSLSSHDSLEKMALQGLDYSIDLAGLKDGERVLDIGCGWGSLPLRLNERFESISYFGISPSTAQIKYCQHNFEENDFKLCTFEEYNDKDQSFDCIFFNDSICHIKDKVTALSKAKRLLNPGGRVILQDTFFYSNELYERHRNHGKTKFVQKEIFGWAHIYSFSKMMDLITSSELKVSSLSEITDSYVQTIGHWIKNLQVSGSDIDQNLALSFEKYLNFALEGFNNTTGQYILRCEKIGKNY